MDRHGADSMEAVAADYWEMHLRESPESATAFGDHRWDDRLTELSPDAVARRVASAADLRARLDALGSLDGEEGATAALLRVYLDDIVNGARFRFEELAVDPLDGPQAALPRLAASVHPRRGAGDIASLAARYRAFGVQVEEHIAQLRAGVAAGRVAPRVLVERVIAQLRDALTVDPSRSPLVEGIERAAHADLVAGVRDAVHPGLRRLLDFLSVEYMPRARDEVGLWAIPDGRAAYAHAIRRETTSHLTADEIHALGLSEVRRIDAEIRACAGVEAGSDDGARAALLRLRREATGFRDVVALLAAYRDAVARFREGTAGAFGSVALDELCVEVMPAGMEGHAAGAFYQRPDEDAARPGTFYVNAANLGAHARFEVEVLAAHEGIPGHHLQIGVARKIQARSMLRRHGKVTAFVEGWAVYAERLVDELGLYSTLDARLGMLTRQALRAARLVVDTGLHALGWPRERAVAYLSAHTALPAHVVEMEINRYIAWPAQALAYHLGLLEILAARADAKRALGAHFALAAFHDHLLASGAVPLPTMREAILRWATVQGGR